MRDCLHRLLEAAGLVMLPPYAEPGAFLAALAVERPQVALLDLSESGLEGLTLVEEAHQLFPEVRLLIITSRLEPELMDRCFRAGAAGYLDASTAKLEGLTDAIQAVVRGNHVFPAHALESLLRAPSRKSPGGALLQGLSDRERDVLSYLSVGADNLQIATRLKISERTVKAHVSNLYRKLGQDNRTQLALLARQSGVRAPAPVSVEPEQRR